MTTSGVLGIGDRVRLSGGYSFEPAWLAGKEFVNGTVVTFLPGQNDKAAALVKVTEPISYEGVTGDNLVLELRYVDAVWSDTGVVHIELCDFAPEAAPWQDRSKGKWAESHATYKKLPI